MADVLILSATPDPAFSPLLLQGGGAVLPFAVEGLCLDLVSTTCLSGKWCSW